MKYVYKHIINKPITLKYGKIKLYRGNNGYWKCSAECHMCNFNPKLCSCHDGPSVATYPVLYQLEREQKIEAILK